MTSKKTNWFESWFDTTLYHTLYKNRNEKEAKQFIENLFRFFNPDKNAKVLDLACGKGRHAITINALGFDVTGLDLSTNSIQYAKKKTSNSLRFDVHDMRKVYNPAIKFDIILNLFTSFGYFDNESEDISVLKAVHTQLTDEGFFLLDYLNVFYAEKNLVQLEKKDIDGTLFSIERKVFDGFIRKKITAQTKNSRQTFEEQVKYLTVDDFKKYFHDAGLNLIHIFGNYFLEEYNKENSPRLIMVCKKGLN